MVEGQVSSFGEDCSFLDYSLSNHSEVSLSSLIFVFNEIVQHCLESSNSGVQLEQRLHSIGVTLGPKILELVAIKERNYRHETKIIPLLTYIATTVWKYLFNHHAELLKSKDNADEYLITDKRMVLTLYVSIPRDGHQPVLAAYVAGIVEGMLKGVDIEGHVTAHTVMQEDGNYVTTLLIAMKNEGEAKTS